MAKIQGAILLPLLVSLCFVDESSAFASSSFSCGTSPLPDTFRCQRSMRQAVLSMSSNDDPSEIYKEEEIEEMKGLILSLSLESEDEARRQRVIEIFDEALARPNGMPKRFTDLFDRVLIQVGDQVQFEAKKQYFEDQAAQGDDPESLTEKGEESIGVDDEEAPRVRMKSPQEQQLWALVDMMVQTKTIVKKDNGELGSKGTFQ